MVKRLLETQAQREASSYATKVAYAAGSARADVDAHQQRRDTKWCVSTPYTDSKTTVSHSIGTKKGFRLVAGTLF